MNDRQRRRYENVDAFLCVCVCVALCVLAYGGVMVVVVAVSVVCGMCERLYEHTTRLLRDD